MSDHERLEELAHLYPLGGLDPDEKLLVDRHLATGCETCERLLLDSLRVAGQLLHAVDPMPPSPRVKQELLDRVQRDQGRAAGQATVTRTPARAWLGLAASLVAAVGLGIYALSLQSESDALRSALLQEEASRQAADARAAELESRLAMLTAPGARAVSLSGQGDSAGARARAFLDPDNGQLLLYVYDLPPLPAGQTYQLWVIVEGMPFSAGTFDVDPDGNARFDAEPLPTVDAGATVALAVTVEPAGGVPQPTGPMVLVES